MKHLIQFSKSSSVVALRFHSIQPLGEWTQKMLRNRTESGKRRNRKLKHKFRQGHRHVNWIRLNWINIFCDERNTGKVEAMMEGRKRVSVGFV